MHDEGEAVKEIKGLSLNARMHLSHVMRNGLACILSATKQADPIRAEREIHRFMSNVEKMDL